MNIDTAQKLFYYIASASIGSALTYSFLGYTLQPLCLLVVALVAGIFGFLLKTNN